MTMWRTVVHRGVVGKDHGMEDTDLRVRDIEGAWDMQDTVEVSPVPVRSWQCINPITVRWFHMSDLVAMSKGTEDMEDTEDTEVTGATEVTEAMEAMEAIMEATATENLTMATVAETGMERPEDAGEYGRTTLDGHAFGQQIQPIYRPSEGFRLAFKPRIFDRFTVLSQFPIALQQVLVPAKPPSHERQASSFSPELRYLSV
jgi:hypothetical protein